ncbi:MAG: methyltransferase domain-containing protein [bacterium]|nr:methyltransferase domain-containing protein [bacterium]
MKPHLPELTYVEQYCRIPEHPAPDSRFKFLKRFVTRCVLHFIRGQNEFNVRMAHVVRALQEQVDDYRTEILERIERTEAAVESTVAALQRQGQQGSAVASMLSKRLHDSDQRQDAIVASLHATDVRLDELISRVDKVVDSLSSTDRRVEGLTERIDEELTEVDRRQDDLVGLVQRNDKRIDEVISREDAIVQSVAATNRELENMVRRQDAIVASLHQTDKRLEELARHYDALVSFAPLAQAHAQRLQTLEQETALFRERIRALGQREDELAVEIARLQESASRFAQIAEELERLKGQCNRVVEELGGVRKALESCESSVTRIRSAYEEEARGVAARMQEVQSLATELRVTVEEHLNRAAGILTRISRARRGQQRANQMSGEGELVEGARTVALLPSASAYQAYEESQRGSEELVYTRLRAYVPWLQRAPLGGEAVILDLGSGRGEFLELLRDAGLTGYGVDINPLAVQHARAKGLDVREEDLFDALRKVKPHSLAAITAFHVIEHFPFHAICQMIALARRALLPGGLLLMETPNVFNLQVAASDFYKDPTHVRPVHPVTLDLWLRYHGFSETHIEFVHPFPRSEQLEVTQAIKPEVLRRNLKRVNELLYGYRDCAIIATAGRLYGLPMLAEQSKADGRDYAKKG